MDEAKALETLVQAALWKDLDRVGAGALHTYGPQSQNHRLTHCMMEKRVWRVNDGERPFGVLQGLPTTQPLTHPYWIRKWGLRDAAGIYKSP
jgi:hypothetical protein